MTQVFDHADRLKSYDILADLYKENFPSGG